MIITCIFCGKPCNEIYDFGKQPYSSALGTENTVSELFSLRLQHCSSCDLVQANRNIFRFEERYQYHSGIAKAYASELEFFYKAFLRGASFENHVITEIGCNDGTLLSLFQKMGFKQLHGFEPVSHLANRAVEVSYAKVIAEPFSLSTFGRVPKSDLVILNQTFQCLPNLNEIVEALRLLVKSTARIIIEVPDFEAIVKQNLWDTIYHENASYFTQSSMLNIMGKYFAIERVDETLLPLPGRRYIFVPKAIPDYNVRNDPYVYDVGAFQRFIGFTKFAYLETLIQWKKMHKLEIAAAGACSKASAFFNFLGVDRDLISYCVDETPGKWGKLMSKSNIPIISLQEYIGKTKKPDIMLITAWNYQKDLKDKLGHAACWVKTGNGEFKRV